MNLAPEKVYRWVYRLFVAQAATGATKTLHAQEGSYQAFVSLIKSSAWRSRFASDEWDVYPIGRCIRMEK